MNTMRNMQKDNQRGQIALIAMLIMVVILTIGLSIATRQTQDVQLTRQETEGSYTFQAAESGVEEALSALHNDAENPPTGGIDSTVTLNDGRKVAVNTDVAASPTFTTEKKVKQGESVQIKLNAMPAGARFLPFAFAEGTCESAGNPEILINVYNKSAGGVYSVRHYGVGCADSNPDESGFVYDTPISGGATYYNGEIILSDYASESWGRKVDVRIVQGDTIVSLHPMKADTKIKVLSPSGWTLPPQQFTITSSAKNESGTEAKKIEVNRSLDFYPSFMDFAVYSNGSIVK